MQGVATVRVAASEFSALMPDGVQAHSHIGSAVSYVLPAYRVKIGQNCSNTLLGQLRGVAFVNGRLRAEFETVTLGTLRADFDSTVQADSITSQVSLRGTKEDAFILPP
jgi:hypothetical protein